MPKWFIKSARLLFHNKLTLFCTQCYVCLQFTQDLFVNKAIPWPKTSTSDFYRTVCFKEQREALLRKTLMSRVKIIKQILETMKEQSVVWWVQKLYVWCKPTDHLRRQLCFSSSVGTGRQKKSWPEKKEKGVLDLLKFEVGKHSCEMMD